MRLHLGIVLAVCLAVVAGPAWEGLAQKPAQPKKDKGKAKPKTPPKKPAKKPAKKPPKKKEQPKDLLYPVDPELKVKPLFLDEGLVISGKKDLALGDRPMRFGVIQPHVKDPVAAPDNPTGKKRLTYFPKGTSNNTCLRLDGQEYLLGSGKHGRWSEYSITLGKTDDREREGKTSVYVYPKEKIRVTQTVEVVPGDQPAKVDFRGKNQWVRQLDTVLVRYEIENTGDDDHQVGLRFLLDTFVGASDGVPFVIPGQGGLCSTMKHLKNSKEIPDYLVALEKPDLKDPGTIARLSLHQKGLESPGRVTVGAWPHYSLKSETGGEMARGHMTLWDVPLLSMQAGGRKDSAVVMYWNERTLKPQEKRVVGFAYGLARLAQTGGKLGVLAGGNFDKGQTFTVTALVKRPDKGDTAMLKLPDGLALAEGTATKTIPALAGKSPSRSGKSDTPFSPVAWKVKSTKEGLAQLTVELSSGESQDLTVSVPGHLQKAVKK